MENCLLGHEKKLLTVEDKMGLLLRKTAANQCIRLVRLKQTADNLCMRFSVGSFRMTTLKVLYWLG